MDTVAVQKLVKAGIPVVGDTSDGLMHDKFIVVDDQVRVDRVVQCHR